jgi:hypothetical protein
MAVCTIINLYLIGTLLFSYSVIQIVAASRILTPCRTVIDTDVTHLLLLFTRSRTSVQVDPEVVFMTNISTWSSCSSNDCTKIPTAGDCLTLLTF